jgi:hypothetical protein
MKSITFAFIFILFTCITARAQNEAEKRTARESVISLKLGISVASARILIDALDSNFVAVKATMADTLLKGDLRTQRIKALQEDCRRRISALVTPVQFRLLGSESRQLSLAKRQAHQQAFRAQSDKLKSKSGSNPDHQ